MSTLDLTADAHLQVMPTAPSFRTIANRLWGAATWNKIELRVLATETSTDVWVISTFPGLQSTPTEDLNDADHVFHGGNTYEVSGSLATALDEAGYIVMPGFSSGFSSGFEVAI